MPIQPTISERSNKNYLAKIFLLKESMIKKHPNADRLSIIDVDYQPVISNNPVPNQWYIYFPTESQINRDFLSFSNSYRDKELNQDKEATPGFFEPNARVKTVKLRGSYSSGYMVPLSNVEAFIGSPIENKETYFDMLGNIQLVKKYRKPFERAEQARSLSKADKKTQKLNVVEGQFQFHEDTENLRKNLFRLYPEDIINVSYKTHGTSFIGGNLLHKRIVKAKWYQKLVGVKDREETYYDYICSSRKVIKGKAQIEDTGFYKEDIWQHALETIKDRIPKGWTIYAELLGQMSSGQWIQKDYDYGTNPQEYDIMPYRITVTNIDGDEIELDSDQIIEWSKKNSLRPMHSYFTGSLLDHYISLMEKQNDSYANEILIEYNEAKVNQYSENERFESILNSFRASYLHMLEKEYNEKDCFMCMNKVPEEGIIIRKLKHYSKFEAYKLKSMRFLGLESEQADKGIQDIEEEQSIEEVI